MSEQATSNGSSGANAKARRTVRDQYGAPYIITGIVGEGGQGKVCKTDHPNTLVKIFTQKNRDKEERWFNHVQWILRQDLEGLAIASPKALITSPRPGYVMELMDGLHPLLSEMEKSFNSLLEGEGLAGFIETGGLRRRLAILSEIANSLSRLHSRGLAYGDLSPSNIFVSENSQHARVWLIDCDNICTNERAGFDHLYTPGYGAPEVVRGETGVNSLTDAWSFAVIAYQFLTNQHPLLGELADSDPELEEKAYRGELPWAKDTEDDSNHASGGIPVEIVASQQMRELFQRCFENGKQLAWERPTVAEWRDVLDKAISMIQDCHGEGCESTFLRDDICPFCDAEVDPNSVMLLSSLIYSNDDQLERKLMKTGYGRLVNKGETVSLKRAPAGTSLFRESSEVCEVRLDDDAVAVKVTPGQKIKLMSGGQEQEVTRGFRLGEDKKQGRSYFLHIIPDQHTEEPSVHPVWAFRW